MGAEFGVRASQDKAWPAALKPDLMAPLIVPLPEVGPVHMNSPASSNELLTGSESSAAASAGCPDRMNDPEPAGSSISVASHHAASLRCTQYRYARRLI